ncbi:MAG TPA: hypothetical protein VGA56_08205 [Opitutaceae bacterium]
MNIDPLNNSNYLYSVRGKPQINGHRQAQDNPISHDQLSVGTSSKIRQALDQIPEIRPEVVERGRMLAADPSYPPRDVVQKIAQLITPFTEE